MIHVGIDWASDHHDVVVVDETGERRSSFRIDNNAEGLNTLLRRLTEFMLADGGKESILIGIETSRLLLVDVLLNAGYTIYPLNPKAVDRYRDRYRASRTKSDDFDAEVIAQALRTDRDRLRPLHPDSPLLRELRMLVRDQRRFIRTRTLFLNQLQACLRDYFPVVLDLFDDLSSTTALAFLRKHPRPEPVKAHKLEKLLREHRHPHPEKKSLEMAEKLAKPIPVEEFTVRAKTRSMLTIVEQIQTLQDRLKEYEAEITALFDRHPDAPVFKSLPGAGPGNGPRLLCEIGDNRDRYPDADGLQGEAGTSPVTRASGKSHVVSMRYACRKPFREVMHHFAFCSLRQSVWAREYYDRRRTGGSGNAAALRALADKWLKIIHRLWKDRVPYDENVYLADRMRHQLRHAPLAA